MTSPESQSILHQAFSSQANVHFTQAAELTLASYVLQREMTTGHNYIDPPLTSDQVIQRKQILGIALAVLEAARKRALDDFYGNMKSKDLYNADR